MSHGEVLRTHQSGLSGSGFWEACGMESSRLQKVSGVGMAHPMTRRRIKASGSFRLG
ncbi:hypothetical protein Plhal304r1_c092g0171971 [Plasmopara halstedii]